MFLHLSVILFTGAVHPLGSHPPLGRQPPGQTPIPLGRPPGQTHPSPDGHCSRRYASYLNAFLLLPAMNLEQSYVFTGMCDSVHRGVSASVYAGIPPPLGADPLGADTPQSRHPPCTEHAGRYGQRTGSTHPTGMKSCFCKVSLSFNFPFAKLGPKIFEASMCFFLHLEDIIPVLNLW